MNQMGHGVGKAEAAANPTHLPDRLRTAGGLLAGLGGSVAGRYSRITQTSR